MNIVFLTIVLIVLGAQVTFAGFADDRKVCEYQVLPRLQTNRLLESATAPGDQYCLAIFNWIGPLAQKNYPVSAQWLQKASNQNHPAAQAMLGFFFQMGHGVTQNYAEAMKWYRKAADQGNLDAMTAIGKLYEQGNGVGKDVNEAVKWYRMAADRGDPTARNNLQALAQPRSVQTVSPGEHYFQEGKRLYLANDYVAAAKPFFKAAEMGHVLAQLQIGSQYEFGEGLPKNYGEAVKWYAKAADQGNAVSQKNLGQMYEDGTGVTENWLEAAKWYRKSADQNYDKGQNALGRAYQFGIGVPQSRREAIEWYKRAAAQGNSQADYFAKHLSYQGTSIGFRNEAEHAQVIAGKLRFSLELLDEPVGVTFRNSSERLAYLTKLRGRVDQNEAKTMWNIKKKEYDDCLRAKRSPCFDPGPTP